MVGVAMFVPNIKLKIASEYEFQIVLTFVVEVIVNRGLGYKIEGIL